MPEIELKHAEKKDNKKKRKKRKKQNIFVSFFSGLFPWKGDSVGTVIRKLIFLVSLAVLVFAGIKLVDFYVLRDLKNNSESQEWADKKEENASDEKITILVKDDDDSSDSSQGGETEVEVLEEYVSYYEENNDFVGWVTIYPYVNYPVVQAEDNDYYLKHNFYKVPTENGTVFADYEGEFTPTSRPANIILYGHNLITNNLFQPLSNYRPDKAGIDFLKDNYQISFDTLYERNVYNIFSIFLVNTNPNQGEVFNYVEDVYFDTEKEFNDFVSECLDRSYYYTGVDLEYGDELLTLSTCDFSMFSDMRLVVVARKVRENESPLLDTDAFIDNYGFDENGNVKRKMFEAYYDAWSCEWAGRQWDSSYVKNIEKTDAIPDSE